MTFGGAACPQAAPERVGDNAFHLVDSSKQKCPGLKVRVGNDGGRSADRAARRGNWLLAQVETLQQVVVLGQVVPLQVIQKLAPAAGHLEKATAAVEVLAMPPQMLGQVIDPGGKQGDLDVAGAGVLLVNLVLSDDFVFCYRHGFVLVTQL